MTNVGAQKLHNCERPAYDSRSLRAKNCQDVEKNLWPLIKFGKEPKYNQH